MNATTKALFDTICRGIGARDPENTPKANNAVTELARAIDSLEAEAATAAASLEAAKGSVKIYAKAAGYEGADSLSGFAEHLKELVDGNKAKATHITNLNGEISALQNQLREAVERNKTQAEYFDKLCKITSSPSHDLDKLVVDVAVLKQERDEWRKVAVDRAKTRDQRGKHFTEAQQQSQPQPLPCHTLQTHQSDPATTEIQKGCNEEAWKHEPELRLARAKRDAYREELESANDKIKKLEKAEQERDFFRQQCEAYISERNVARDEANSLRAERDRYAKIIDRL